MSVVKKVLAVNAAFTLALVLLLAPQDGFAHTKKYVFNREYKTLPQGSFEIESWVKMKVPDIQRSDVNTFEYEQELEYGVTDHLTIAHYQRWRTSNRNGKDDSTTYRGFKVEAKYRFGEKGKYWVDPLLYLEWVTDPKNSSNPNKIEAKLILSKDIGNFNVVYNQIMESELASGGRTEQNFAFGMSYTLPFEITVGVEGKGNYWRPSSHRNKLALGPTVAWEGQYFWVAAGADFGVNREADDVEARVVVGVPF